MEHRGMVKVEQAFIALPDAPLTLIGDPGCDGLGAATMSIFARALSLAGEGTALVLGDIVHRGIPILYGSVCEFAATVSKGPVYMLCGNHDTAQYAPWFGLRNYVLYNQKVCYIVLDDSARAFSTEALDLLETSLARFTDQRLVLLFHIPPPNPVGTNTIPSGEWEKVRQLLEPFRSRVDLLVCGHVHSFYETLIDGYPLMVSGGGGARLEWVSEKVEPARAVHHVLRISAGPGGRMGAEWIPLAPYPYTRELQDPRLKELLEASLLGEMEAHLAYLLHAEAASDAGYPGIAAMFRAFADAEYHHARNHWHSLGKMKDLRTRLVESIENEAHEVEHFYLDAHAYARTQGHGLAAYSFLDALEAEKTHLRFARSALEALDSGQDLPESTWRTCTSCGYTFQGETHPAHCPVCGAPADRIREVP